MPIDSPYRALLDALPQRARRVEIDGVGTAVFEYGPADAPPIARFTTACFRTAVRRCRSCAPR